MEIVLKIPTDEAPTQKKQGRDAIAVLIGWLLGPRRTSISDERGWEGKLAVACGDWRKEPVLSLLSSVLMGGEVGGRGATEIQPVIGG